MCETFPRLLAFCAAIQLRRPGGEGLARRLAALRPADEAAFRETWAAAADDVSPTANMDEVGLSERFRIIDMWRNDIHASRLHHSTASFKGTPNPPTMQFGLGLWPRQVAEHSGRSGETPTATRVADMLHTRQEAGKAGSLGRSS